MKKNTKHNLPVFSASLVSSLLFFYVLVSETALAQGYTLLAKLPLGPETMPDLSEYMQWLFVALVGLSIVLAVIMIVVGGIQYVMAFVPSSVEEGKKRIISAILGLLLVLISYLLIGAINPKLLYVGLNLPVIGIIGGGGGGVPPPPPPPPSPSDDPEAEYGASDWGGGCTSPRPACNDPRFISLVKSNSAGIDANLLYTMLVGGEGCNPAAGDHTSCGYGQVLAPNRKVYCGLDGDRSDCELFARDLEADINCAATYIKKDLKSCFPFNPTTIPNPTPSTVLAVHGSAGYIGGCYNGGPHRKKIICGTDAYCVRIQTFYNRCVSTPP